MQTPQAEGEGHQAEEDRHQAQEDRHQAAVVEERGRRRRRLHCLLLACNTRQVPRASRRRGTVTTQTLQQVVARKLKINDRCSYRPVVCIIAPTSTTLHTRGFVHLTRKIAPSVWLRQQQPEQRS